ncbi:MAG: hypothetical protein HY851_06740 [candidate division Zixibacteria bacterium]|nr:hypothetical protein [candidate division Zixibacteria bacterium]
MPIILLLSPARRLRYFAFVLTLVLVSIAVTGCVQQVMRRVTAPENASTLDHRSPYLKAHLKNGNVAVISKWSVDQLKREVLGQGTLLSPNRTTLETGSLVIPIDSVALFETNVLKPSPAIISMAVVTGASAVLTIICLSNPKTCFGSCPTFYWSDGKDTTLVAEGFSSSIAPSLERTDIDALFSVKPVSRTLSLHLTNEALETHVIRQTVLLAAPKRGHAGVVKDHHDTLWAVTGYREPVACTDESGSCLDLVRAFDHRERYSLADSTDLAAKETVNVTFVSPHHQSVGLVIGSRQTLLSTYLYYQSLAYLGTRAVDFLSQLERGSATARTAAYGLGSILGGMTVELLQTDGTWRVVDSVLETGPLATDVVVVPLPAEHTDTLHCRIRLNKGHWRIDYLALADLDGQVAPIRIEPTEVRSFGNEDRKACGLLSSDAAVLVTMPGDQNDISYSLPPNPSQYEYFLESRGYYLEWMRDEWLAEENPAKAAQIFLDPEGFLKQAAPEYKRTEKEMEGYFWGSKYAR